VGRVLEKDLFHSMDELRREGGGGLRGGLREGRREEEIWRGGKETRSEKFFLFFMCT
jgi:hypothetical protein